MVIQEKPTVFDLDWAEGVTWRDVFQENERQWSHYNFEEAPVDVLMRRFSEYEEESTHLVSTGLPLPAYDFCLKCSHAFNLLDARGAISVTERQGYILKVRKLAHDCAKLYLTTRAKMQFPALKDRAIADRELARYAELVKE